MGDCQRQLERLAAVELAADERAELTAHLATCGACAQAATRLGALDGALGDLVGEPAAPPPFERIAGAARRSARRRRGVRVAHRTTPFVLAAAAGMAVAALVIWPGRQARPAAHGAAIVPPAPRLVGSGERLESSGAPVHGRLASGAQVTVESGQVQLAALDDRGEALELASGRLALQVPRLEAGRSVRVRTAEAEAELRAGAARVEVARVDGGTRVTVIEGAVEIQPADATQSIIVLHRGETVLVEDSSHARARLRATAIDALEHGRGVDAEASLKEWLERRPPALEVAEVHALYGWKHVGDGHPAAAIDSYRRSLALLPEGAAPLWADNALAQLALLVERDDPRASAGLWRQYLERFPRGAHAARARARLEHPARAR